MPLVITLEEDWFAKLFVSANDRHTIRTDLEKRCQPEKSAQTAKLALKRSAFGFFGFSGIAAKELKR